MKLLFDENISYRILKLIQKEFPHSQHVSKLKIYPLTDRAIWNYAKHNDFVVVTYDEDFYDIQIISGDLPKLVWLRFGNRRTRSIADKLIECKERIQHLSEDPDVGVLEIY